MDARSVFLMLALVLGAGAAAAEPPAPVATAAVDPLDALETLGYQPLTVVSGTLRLAGSTTLQQAAALWADGFTAVHPDVVVAIDSTGSDAGWKALVAGAADAALLSRPVDDAERKAFGEADGKRKLVVVPVGFERLVWIVHAANPIAELRWSPATGVIIPAGDAAGAATTWRRLGAEGEAAAVPLRVHATELGSGTRWHLDRLLTGTTALPIDVKEHATIRDLATAVASDRGGLGLIGDNDGAWPGVRTLPLAIPADAPPVADAVPGSERTPDCRPLFLALTVPHDGERPALLREFVAYVLSWQGQLDVAQDGLLPLTRAEVLAQREILGGPVER
ncbi:MAG: PstS family phosphate ABC transporter substrate-binding protein [Planctomycetia bacterium]